MRGNRQHGAYQVNAEATKQLELTVATDDMVTGLAIAVTESPNFTKSAAWVNIVTVHLPVHKQCSG